MCLKGFQGYGYDEDFTQNMKRISDLRKSQNVTVEITNAPDDICRACPNLKGDVCRDNDQNINITRMDNEVIKKIDATREHDSIELFDKIDEIFNTAESVSEICSNCMWHEKCLFYQKLSNNR